MQFLLFQGKDFGGFVGDFAFLQELADAGDDRVAVGIYFVYEGAEV